MVSTSALTGGLAPSARACIGRIATGGAKVNDSVDDRELGGVNKPCDEVLAAAAVPGDGCSQGFGGKGGGADGRDGGGVNSPCGDALAANPAAGDGC
jgi:hypothetical protein